MRKKLLLFSAGLILSSLVSLNAQQVTTTSSGCPGVPGACGYHASNSSATQRTTSGGISPQDGNGTLANTYTFTKCGLNFTTASQRLGQRFTPAGVPQPATFTISGIPSCATIEKAYLYTDASGNGIAATATILPPSGPSQNFPMTIIGQGPDKCWGYSGSYTYRADVTSVITGSGNYMISGLPTNPPTAGNDVDGATLIVIYSDPTVTYQGTLIIDDGAQISGGGTISYNMNYAPVCGPTQNAVAFLCVGDIQFTVSSISLNGTPTTFAWNWWNYVSTPTTVNAAQSTSNYTITTSTDCYNFCVAGLYYQTTCSTCVPASNNITMTPASTPSTCSGCDGTATVSVSPAGSYTYSWSPSGQTTQTATNLCSGTYTVTVTGSCASGTTAVTVNNSANLSASVQSQGNVTCNGANDGTASVSASGGTAPYTYSWSPIGGTNPTASNLPPGTYTCTVTDNNGCTSTQQITITEPAVLSTTFNDTNATCNGSNNGNATAAPSGGTGPYTYSWSTGATTATISNLSPGTYTVDITDANGCTTSQTTTITQPAVLTASVTTQPVSCFGNGSATASPSGGTGPYTYSWSPTSQTTQTATNLPAGTYTVTVTDAHGCTTTQIDSVAQNNVLNVSVTSSNINCFGDNNGSATVTPNGGNPPYTYSWSPTGGNNATASGLPAGNYTCTITDQSGCTTTQTVTITQPATALSSSAIHTNVSCNGGNNGTAGVNASGGTPGYTYSWSPAGGNGANASSLTAGTYTVLITDANGCTSTQQITITQPPALTLSVPGDSVCLGNSANVTATAGGGVSPYTYSWSTGATSASTTVQPAATTTYTVSVTDANGCVTTGTSTVNVNPLPVAAFSANTTNGYFILYNATGDLCLTDQSSGANAWAWNINGVPSLQQSPCITLSAADTGLFCVNLITANSHGCLDTANDCFDVIREYYMIPNVFTPNGDGSNDVFTITNIGFETVRCTLYNRWGEYVYSWDSPLGYWDGKTKSGNLASDGVYYYVATLVDFEGKVFNEKGFVHLLKDKK